MPGHTVRHCITLFTGVWLSLLNSLSPLHAQPKQSLPSLTATQVSLKCHSQTFAAISKALSQQTQRSILADGESLRLQADMEFTGTAKEALDRFADAFDYTWSEGKHGVILMRKRFTAATDLPQMNRPEWQRVARDMLDVFDALAFDPDNDPMPNYATRLFRMFTQDQIQLLQSGKTLYGRQLTAPQQTLLQQLEFNGYFAAGYAAWQRLLETLSALPSSYVQYRHQAVNVQKGVSSSGNSKTAKGEILSFNLIYRNKAGMEQIAPLAYKFVQEEKKP